MSTTEIYNYLKINDRLITGGQPTAEQLHAAAAEGFTSVINLAVVSPATPLQDEDALVRSLGMSYDYIPVDWNNPTDEDFSRFEQTLARLSSGKVLLHCAANFRVTAFYSLYAQKHLGWSVADADALRAKIWSGSDYPVWEAFIARKRAELADKPDVSDFPKGLSAPARRALAGAGYLRLEQLTHVTEAELLKLHGLGPKTIRQLREALAVRGLAFARDSG